MDKSEFSTGEEWLAIKKYLLDEQQIAKDQIVLAAGNPGPDLTKHNLSQLKNAEKIRLIDWFLELPDDLLKEDKDGE
jgi:hypothetical protein